MLNGIPLGSTSRIVSNGDVEIKGIDELGLDFGFPRATTATVAAAGISENEKLARLGILKGFQYPRFNVELVPQPMLLNPTESVVTENTDDFGSGLAREDWGDS